MRILVLSLALAMLAGCATPAPGAPPGLCRPAGLSAGMLEIGGTDFSDRVVAVDVAYSERSASTEINLTFDEAGAAELASLTAARISEPLPIAVDGEVISSPYVMEAITGGAAVITGSFTEEEATALARRLAPPCP